MLPQVFVTTRELLNSGQGRWQSPAAAPGMEIFHSCSCTAFWAKKHKLICFGSKSWGKCPDFPSVFSLSLSRYFPARGVCFNLREKSGPNTDTKAGIFPSVSSFFPISSVPFPQLTVTKGTGGINRGERICSLVQMKSKWEEQGVHFYLLICVPACAEMHFLIPHKHLV